MTSLCSWLVANKHHVKWHTLLFIIVKCSVLLSGGITVLLQITAVIFIITCASFVNYCFSWNLCSFLVVGRSVELIVAK